MTGRLCPNRTVRASAAALRCSERADPRCPYTVDTRLAFQMAARPDIFTNRFALVLRDGPINQPIVLTRSRADRYSRSELDRRIVNVEPRCRLAR